MNFAMLKELKVIIKIAFLLCNNEVLSFVNTIRKQKVGRTKASTRPRYTGVDDC